MKKVSIHIAKTITDVFAVDEKDGQKIFSLISAKFQENKKVILSFQHIEILTVAFLNASIGQLYAHFSDSFIQDHLIIVDISESGSIALKRVVETAKLYYHDPEGLKKSMEEFLEE